MLLYAIVIVLAVVFIQPPLSATQTGLSNIKTAVPARESNKAIVAAETNTQGKSGSRENSTELQSQSDDKETAATSETVKTQEPAPQISTTKAEPAPITTCEEAIAAVWPADLQPGARLVSTKESSLVKTRIGPLKNDGSVGYNYDGSRDYGCFQINDKAHPQFFSNGDWRDPVYNAQYALKIYKERGNWTAWYAVRGLLW